MTPQCTACPATNTVTEYNQDLAAFPQKLLQTETELKRNVNVNVNVGVTIRNTT